MKKNISVLMVNYEFPPIGGGGGTTTRFLAKFMAKLGIDVNVITSKPGGEDSFNHPDGFKLYYVGPTKKKIHATHLPELARFILTTSFYAKKAIDIIKPDLIHCFFTLPSGCFGLYCNKLFKIPYIVSALGADVPGFNIGDWRLNLYHDLTRPLSRAIWDNSSYIVANSSTLANICTKFDSFKEIPVIPNGVDSSLFYPDKNKTFSNIPVQLLFASRLMPQKGIEMLIKACGILKQREVKNYKLTVVGDGHLKPLMYSMIKEMSLENYINHIGWTTLEELPDYYRNADAFILPSSMEGMPSVILQAMSCGLPIIVTKVDGFSEIFEENVNGLSVEFNNSAQLADAMETIINSPEMRERMSKASIEKAKYFSWESIANSYLNLYEKSLGIKKTDNSLLECTLH